MDSTLAIARQALDQMPPQCRMEPLHAECLARHTDQLKGIGPDLVRAFYDTVFGHRETAKIFHDGERGMREESLVDWWVRTVEGPFDDDYWAWMTLVGLIHVVRRVSNPSMLAMTSFVGDHIAAEP